jgi:hypothetical protein
VGGAAAALGSLHDVVVPPAGPTEASAIKDDIQRARAELLAERKFQADLRRIERGNQQRRKEAPRITRLERQGEGDDQVRASLPADLLGLFERVKRSIKATPRMSRLDQFLRYAEEHPDEVLLSIEDKTEAVIRDLERQQREARRSLRRRPPPRIPSRPGVDPASDVPF